jgi:hypothetical protein
MAAKHELDFQSAIKAMLKARDQSTQTGELQGQFRCEKCQNGVVTWGIMSLKKHTTRGSCSTKGCIQWIE